MSAVLVINADDLGMSPEVNEGIIEGLAAGVISDASVLVGAPCTEDACRSLERIRLTHVGVHINLDGQLGWSSPGRERFSREELMARLEHGELSETCRDEARRQIEGFMSYGLTPTHLDTHHHVHGFWPVFSLLVDLMQDYRIPAMRFSRTGYRLLSRDPIPFDRRIYAQMEATLRGRGIMFCTQVLEGVHTFSQIGHHTCELVVHPARGGDAWREKELDGLLSGEVRDTLRRRQVHLTNYRDLVLNRNRGLDD
ncbi:MAG: carbohydrate deacetylase [Desulfomonilia bacterium]